MSYVLNTPAEQQEMLKQIGVASVEELFANIPPPLRLKRSSRSIESSPAT